MTESNDNGNGRISNADRLARIETKLDMVLELVPRVNALEKGAAVRDQQISGLQEGQKDQAEDIEALKSSDRRWGAAGMIVGAIVGALSGLFKP